MEAKDTDSKKDIVPDVAKAVATAKAPKKAKKDTAVLSIKSDEKDETADEQSWGKLNNYLRDLQAERKLIEKKKAPHALRLLEEGALV